MQIILTVIIGLIQIYLAYKQIEMSRNIKQINSVLSGNKIIKGISHVSVTDGSMFDSSNSNY